MSNSSELIKGNEENISQKRASFRAGISFVLLITGYILVADAPKEDAGYAWQTISGI
ncbi:hypothetical protein SAMN05216331_10991 [Porphyromonadaceae bacterium KH3R12]|uniref:hypothetical protein n=1 Tax=Proteiniphilum sp. TaxID=1926877 RepID=UPI0008949689|nr:hypothetical protein [Proteiniphilum sp.]MDY9918942.1 hypothetical protein [Proteiniphilum sp.]SDZ90186.1 hypothetical protein SAMN05216331_10991 [Porphyromonadaceae bacterium KH3R12]